jgi:plastocyanin
MPVRRPGVIAFPVLLVLGAITGYLAYDWMVVKATPIEGIYDNSPYRKEIQQAQATQNQNANSEESEQPTQEVPATDETPAAEDTPAEEESESSVFTISILKGSQVQNNPDYDPDHVTIPLSATIRWVNDDTALHTATSGTGFSEDGYGSKFDTKFLASGKEYSVKASEIGAGEYSYFCLAHPFMVGTLTIEQPT